MFFSYEKLTNILVIIQGDEGHLHQIYYQARRRKKYFSQTKMGAHINKTQAPEQDYLPSQKDIELFEMVDMMVKKNLPIGIVEDPDFR